MLRPSGFDELEKIIAELMQNANHNHQRAIALDDAVAKLATKFMLEDCVHFLQTLRRYRTILGN